MSLKKITAVIFLAVLTGIVIFLGTNLLSDQKITDPTAKKLNIFAKASPTSTPSPSPIPINGSTDLKSEIKTLTPKDYSNDVNSLKIP